MELAARKISECLSNTTKKKKCVKIVEVTNPRSLTLTKLDEILKNNIKSKNLEISIYNWTIQHLKSNKIQPKVSAAKRGRIQIVNNNEISWANNRFKRIYLSKFRSIVFNLTNENNPQFKNNVINNKILTKNIVNMLPHEIYPEIWNGVFQNNLKKEMIILKHQGKELEEAVEGSYTCAKCKCKKITYYELQTRSADEPMTAYFTCLNCEHHWKE